MRSDGRPLSGTGVRASLRTSRGRDRSCRLRDASPRRRRPQRLDEPHASIHLRRREPVHREWRVGGKQERVHPLASGASARAVRRPSLEKSFLMQAPYPAERSGPAADCPTVHATRGRDPVGHERAAGHPPRTAIRQFRAARCALSLLRRSATEPLRLAGVARAGPVYVWAQREATEQHMDPKSVPDVRANEIWSPIELNALNKPGEPDRTLGEFAVALTSPILRPQRCRRSATPSSRPSPL